MSDYVLKTYVSCIDSSKLVPGSFGLGLLNSTTWHDTTYDAVGFTYANRGYGNRTTESIVATIALCGGTFCDCGCSYHGAVDEGKFVPFDSALFIEIGTDYGATGWHTYSYSLRRVHPYQKKAVFSHSLTESALVSGRQVENSYVKLLPNGDGKLPDTVAVLVAHHEFHWQTGLPVKSRRELELFKLDLANDSSYRIPIEAADSADWFRWYRLIQQPVRFEGRLCDTLPCQIRMTGDWE